MHLFTLFPAILLGDTKDSDPLIRAHTLHDETRPILVVIGVISAYFAKHWWGFSSTKADDLPLPLMFCTVRYFFTKERNNPLLGDPLLFNKQAMGLPTTRSMSGSSPRFSYKSSASACHQYFAGRSRGSCWTTSIQYPSMW